MNPKNNRSFRPDSVSAYFKAEWLPLLFITSSGLVSVSYKHLTLPTTSIV